MAQTPEGNIVDAICEYLTLKRHFFHRNNTTPIYDTTKGAFRAMPKYARKGAPDIVCVHQGKYIGIEVKGAKGKLSDDQYAFGHDLTLAGGTYIVARSLAYEVQPRERVAGGKTGQDTSHSSLNRWKETVIREASSAVRDAGITLWHNGGCREKALLECGKLPGVNYEEDCLHPARAVARLNNELHPLLTAERDSATVIRQAGKRRLKKEIPNEVLRAFLGGGL
jgi:hypothetical protein